MDLLHVSLMTDSEDELSRLVCLLQDGLDSVHKASSGELPAEWITHENRIICRALLPRFNLQDHGQPIYRLTAEALAGYIIEKLEPELIRTIISKQHGLQRSEELDSVANCCKQVLSGTHWDYYGDGDESLTEDIKRRKIKIADELTSYIETHTELNLNGFVTFRLKAYWQELRDAAEFAMEEYVMDKQYRDFVSLLKYFVSMQQVKIDQVHLIHREGYEFQLLDEHFAPLETLPGERISAEIADVEMNMEDMVISTLLSVAPAQIIVHTPHPDMQVIRTIETIFENRVTLCLGCHCCENSLEQPYKLWQD